MSARGLAGAVARLEGRLPARGLDALLLIGAGALSGFTLLRGISPHDEGLMLQAAARMAGGEMPYRDFWWNYGPGQPLVLAGLFKAFGPSLLTWRLLRLATDAVVAVLAYRLVRRSAPPPYALGAWLAVAGAMAFPSGPGPNPPALLLTLAGVLLARRSALAAGALAGLAALFRPELGVAAALAVALAAGRAGAARALAASVVAALLAFLPFALAAGPLDLVESTFGFATGEQDLQRLPFPLVYEGGPDPNKVLEFYFPAILIAGFAAWSATAIRSRPPLLALAPLPLAFAGVVYLLGRADEFHLVPLSVALALLLAIGAAREAGHGHRRAGVVLLGFLVLIGGHGLVRRAGQALHPPRLAELRLPAADGVRARPQDATALRALRADLDARVPAGRPLFVANPRHDLVRAGHTLLYVLLDRPNATRYDVMQPGVVTTVEVQQEIVGDLERERPPVIVRWLDPTASRPEPNGAGRSSGVRILDGYLNGRYREARRFGAYALLERRDGR